MAPTVAFVRRHANYSVEIARSAIVGTCGLALLAAGQFLPL